MVIRNTDQYHYREQFFKETDMTKTKSILAASLLLCSVSFAPVAGATSSERLPVVEKSLSDFLPVQGEENPPREEMRKNWEEKRAKMMERIEQLPPEQRAEALKKFEEMKARKEALRAELEALPPEERQARMEELRAEWKEKREARREEFREKFEERWNNASPEEQAEFCANAAQRCEEGGNHACEFAAKSCSAE